MGIYMKKIILMLLSLGAIYSVQAMQRSETSLFNAIGSLEPAAVREMLLTKPNVNAVDSRGIPALSITVREAYTFSNSKFDQKLLDIAKLLLEAGADPNKKDNEGNTPILYLRANDQVPVLELLISYQAKLNEQNNAGWTALMNAAQRGHIDLFKRLLVAGADKTLRNKIGKTALEIAKESAIKAPYFEKDTYQNIINLLQ